ncbi:MAG: cytochrome c [Planctomycetes bacterium]|nr:cytochrome c [Planctomycetota bacterium]
MSTAGRLTFGPYAVALLAAGACVFALRLALVTDHSAPNTEILPEMVRSAAWVSQIDGAPTPDGLSDRPLVAGVVPRGMLPFRYGTTPEEAVRAGAELTNPFRADDTAARERGAVVFARFCAVCHGADGEGEGLAVRHGMTRPPSLRADRALQMKDGQVFHVVTKGQGNMASYAVPIAPDDRWKAILHLRALQTTGTR